MREPDLAEIVIAMESSRELGEYFLDTVTGEVVHIPMELQEMAESGQSDWDLSDWEQDLLPIAEAIYLRGDPRWIWIPEVSSQEIYNQMVKFTQTVMEEHLKELLEVALDGQGAFRRFKNVLAGFPQEQERWYRIKDDYLKREAREWLEALDKTV